MQLDGNPFCTNTMLCVTGRAIEKAIRAYGANVSKLLDICRESIIFDSLSQLISCLQIIRLDRDVLIERIKYSIVFGILLTKL